MATDPMTELARFQQFIGERLVQGQTLSPEEALDLWRTENPCPADDAETVAALREALADMEAGDVGTRLDEFDRLFRCRT